MLLIGSAIALVLIFDSHLKTALSLQIMLLPNTDFSIIKGFRLIYHIKGVFICQTRPCVLFRLNNERHGCYKQCKKASTTVY